MGRCYCYRHKNRIRRTISHFKLNIFALSIFTCEIVNIHMIVHVVLIFFSSALKIITCNFSLRKIIERSPAQHAGPHSAEVSQLHEQKQKQDVHSGVAHGGGGRVPPLTAKNLPKIGEKRGKMRKNRGKRGKIGKIRQKSGRFFHFAPPDR